MHRVLDPELREDQGLIYKLTGPEDLHGFDG